MRSRGPAGVGTGSGKDGTAHDGEDALRQDLGRPSGARGTPGEASVVYIDRHLVHEVTSPQAFEGLRMAGRKVRRPDLTLAVADHNVPTTDRAKGIADPESATQVATLEKQRARIRRRISCR